MPVRRKPPRLDAALTIRERLGALAYLLRLFKEVWTTSPPLTFAALGLRLFTAFQPVVTFYVGKLIVDEAVRLSHLATAATTFKDWFHDGQLNKIIIYVGLEFGLVVCFDTVSRMIQLADSLLSKKHNNRMSIALMVHAAGLDLAHFEDSQHQDELERARGQAGWSSNLLSQVFGQCENLITLMTLFVALFAYALDEARLKAVRDAVENALLAETRPGGAFLPITASRTDRVLEVRETTFGQMDRGSFTRPEMSGVTFGDLPPMFTEVVGDFFRNIIWYELNQRPKVIEEFDTQLGVAALLDGVQDIAADPELGDELILLVPYDPFGNAIHMTTYGFPTEGLESYGLTRETGAENGIGCTYAGTVGKIHIYRWQFPDTAVLCSRTLLKAAYFGRVHDLDTIFDFELYDSGDPIKSMVRMWLAIEFDWEDRLVTEFRLANTVDGSLAGDDNPNA